MHDRVGPNAYGHSRLFALCAIYHNVLERIQDIVGQDGLNFNYIEGLLHTPRKHELHH